MPTGYTDRLEKMDWDLKRWLTEGISRAFGMCVMLRDESNNLDVEQIRKRLEEESNCSYYRERVKETQEEIAGFEATTTDEWRTQIECANKKAAADFEKVKMEKSGKQKKYHETVDMLRLWSKKTDNENFSNFFKFALEQLGMVADEFEMPNPDWYRLYKGTPEDYAANQIQISRDSLSYYEKQLAEKETLNKEQLDLFTSWVEFVETL